MDFKAALINSLNVKPFVPSKPPCSSQARYSNNLFVQRVIGEEAQTQVDTPSRRRRRRRNNAAKRQEPSIMVAQGEQPAMMDAPVSRPKPIHPSMSMGSPLTPPHSRVHTPLHAEFGVPLDPVEPPAPEANTLVLSPRIEPTTIFQQPPHQLKEEDVPTIRLLEASPVALPFAFRDPEEKVPATTLQAIANRARERLAARIQAYCQEQQSVVAAATRIQEAYSTYIGGRLDAILVEMKEHLNKELDSRLSVYEKRWADEIQVVARGMNARDESELQHETVSAIIRSLAAHTELIRSMGLGLQATQKATTLALEEMKDALAQVGPASATISQGEREAIITPMPVLGNIESEPLAVAHPHLNPSFSAARVDGPRVLVPATNSRVTASAPKLGTAPLPKSPVAIRKPVLDLEEEKENAAPRPVVEEGQL